MKRIIIAAAALTLATAVQANPSDPIEAATDSLIRVVQEICARQGVGCGRQNKIFLASRA